MNIKELKVGDRVKYYYPEWIVSDKTIDEGNISRIDDLYITINQALIINKNLIISKLEPLPPQYKEIKIEHEIKTLHPYYCPKCHKGWGLTGISNGIEAKYCPECIDSWKTKSIKLSDLKIGDKVKFYNDNAILEGKIIYIITQNNKIWFNIFSDFHKNTILVHPEKIISKLEEIFDPMTSSKVPIFSKEIPIEKEEEYIINVENLCKFSLDYKRGGFDGWFGKTHGINEIVLSIEAESFSDNAVQSSGLFKPGKKYTIEIKEKNG